MSVSRHRRLVPVPQRRKPPRGAKAKGKQRSSTARRPQRKPDLMREVGEAMSQRSPLPLLALASGLLTVFDSRSEDPFAKEDDDGDFSLADFIQTLIEIPTIEASGLLGVIAGLSDDILLRARVRRELSARPFELPHWIGRFADTVPHRLVDVADVLGDGANILLGLRVADTAELTVVIYIDHNLGAIIKDAFVIDEPIDGVLRRMYQELEPIADAAVRELDPADARARITDAIRHGAITYPPTQTDTWPSCRPMVEWACAGLPTGGHGYQPHEWTDSELEDITTRFFASPGGRSIDDADHRGLLESVLWYGTDYGSGDPMRWSPPKIEILMLDWIPRKIVADASYLAKAPDVLRAFVRFAHAESGIREGLTDDALHAIDSFETEYQQIIRTPRLQGPMALLAAMGAIDEDEALADLLDTRSWQERMRDRLARAVGGAEELARLDETPLPDEPFNWEGIPHDVHERVSEILAIDDEIVGDALGIEYRTACRRLLHTVASRDPTPFRRAARANISAAALCWLVGKANRLFDPGPDQMLVKDLLARFGVTGSVSQRASAFLAAGGFETRYLHEIDLGTPELLVAARRARIRRKLRADVG
jgi:hypothetical protein